MRWFLCYIKVIYSIIIIVKYGGENMRNILDIIESIEDNPIIAAVRDVKDLESAISSKVSVIFMLCGSIINIEQIIKKIKDRGKYVLIHIDLVEGLGRDGAAIEFLKRVGADGIITTKPSLIKDAKSCGIFAIQRLFIVDSRSLETGIKSIIEEHPNAVEIMPAAASGIIKRIYDKVDVPVIAGGLVFDKNDVIDALSLGAVAVSTSQAMLWNE